MTCPAYREIPTGIFGTQRISCGKPQDHKGTHRSDWIEGTRVNELTQTHKVRVEWADLG